jgi:glycine oxidase
VRSFDAIIIGAGIIGLSLARELRKAGLSVLMVDKGEPAREASYAGAGMLVANPVEQRSELRHFAAFSAKIYSTWVQELEEESGLKIDFRRDGAIIFAEEPDAYPTVGLSTDELTNLEPAVSVHPNAWRLDENAIDPRTLNDALIASCKKLEVHIAHGSPAVEVLLQQSRVSVLKTDQTEYRAQVVINAAGAWGSQIKNAELPTRPVKGHMLSLLPKQQSLIRHVIRSRATDVYMLPRTNGPIVVGATVEEVGFDKRVVPETIQKLHQAAAILVPELGEARIHESWVGLRPGSPDGLPMIGEMAARGVYAANGHFRNGILLAPATAKALTAMICNQPKPLDLSAFTPARFAKTNV